jgi:hypothetical protein
MKGIDAGAMPGETRWRAEIAWGFNRREMRDADLFGNRLNRWNVV